MLVAPLVQGFGLVERRLTTSDHLCLVGESFSSRHQHSPSPLGRGAGYVTGVRDIPGCGSALAILRIMIGPSWCSLSDGS